MSAGSPKQFEDVVPPGWPPPSPEECARSHKLTALIRREIDGHRGSIPFARFMELALYTPGLGYYSAAQPKFGERGDYVTAPELSPLFGRCLATQIAQVLAGLDHGDVLEVGAGSGALAAELLRVLEALGRMPGRYLILELSASLRALQQQSIQQQVPHLLDRVRWLDALPPPDFCGVVLGNELLDAMPVSRFCVTDERIAELHVCWDGTRFATCERPATDLLFSRVAPLALARGYCSEVGLWADAWVGSVGAHLARGIVLLVDYGFARAEYYHPQRARGTIMCHYRHRAHSDPLILVGLQDITAHVDFTAVAAAGRDAGLEILGYTSQAAFLIGCGLTDMATEPADPRAQLQRAQSINKLTAPQEMGELFKVIALGRGVRGPLRGFVVQDRRHRL